MEEWVLREKFEGEGKGFVAPVLSNSSVFLWRSPGSAYCFEFCRFWIRSSCFRLHTCLDGCLKLHQCECEIILSGRGPLSFVQYPLFIF